MELNIFGLKFGKSKQPEPIKGRQIVPDPINDGAMVVENVSGSSAHFFVYGSTFDINLKTNKDRIDTYRRMLENPYVDQAVEEIITDAISVGDEKPIIELKLDNTEFSESIQNKIQDEFKNILQILNFDYEATEIFRRWYVDGQQFCHVVVDSDKLSKGIQDIRFIDPRAVQKIVEIKRDTEGFEVDRDEFFIYYPDRENLTTSGIDRRFGVSSITGKDRTIKLTKDSVVYTWSGLQNIDGMPIGYLEKAVKAWNQLNGIEDAVIVYRLSRAPEKRAFLIDVGDLPKTQGERYINQIIEKYQNKTTYNMTTGKVDNNAQIQSMFQDFWIPTRNGRGTQITTIGGTSSNWQSIEELDYFLKKLYRAMKIPLSRITTEGSSGPFSRGSEITRDELKFQKFIFRLRNKFSEMFFELLKRQLLLKNILTLEDWIENVYNIKFDYSMDSVFFEIKSLEILNGRIAALDSIEKYIGPKGKGFFSKDWARKNILRLTEDEIKEMKKQQEKEEQEGEYDGMDEQGGFGDDNTVRHRADPTTGIGDDLGGDGGGERGGESLPDDILLDD